MTGNLTCVWDVGWSHDSANLFHWLKIWRKTWNTPRNTS